MLPPARSSLLAFAVAWEQLELGERPTALTTTSPGATWTERHALVERALDELAGIGWVRQGRITREVREAFELLARPARELYGWAETQDEPMCGRLVASRGEDAVLAHLGTETAAIRGVRPGNLAESLADTLPALRKGPGSPLNFPADALDGTARPATGGGVLTAQRGSTVADRAHALLTRPRLGGAQLFAAHRDDLGTRRRTARKLTVLDTVDGRYTIREREGDGGTWYSIVPTDRDGLVRALVELGAG